MTLRQKRKQPAKMAELAAIPSEYDFSGLFLPEQYYRAILFLLVELVKINGRGPPFASYRTEVIRSCLGIDCCRFCRHPVLRFNDPAFAMREKSLTTLRAKGYKESRDNHLVMPMIYLWRSAQYQRRFTSHKHILVVFSAYFPGFIDSIAASFPANVTLAFRKISVCARGVSRRGRRVFESVAALVLAPDVRRYLFLLRLASALPPRNSPSEKDDRR
jgi:hypothetical protein